MAGLARTRGTPGPPPSHEAGAERRVHHLSGHLAAVLDRHRRHIQHSWLVTDAQYSDVLQFLSNRSLMGRWMPEPGSPHGIYLADLSHCHTTPPMTRTTSCASSAVPAPNSHRQQPRRRHRPAGAPRRRGVLLERQRPRLLPRCPGRSGPALLTAPGRQRPAARPRQRRLVRPRGKPGRTRRPWLPPGR